MRYKVGAEQLEQVPPLAHRPDGVFRSARTALSAQPMRWTPRPAPPPAGEDRGQDVLDQDGEEAFFVEKLPWLFRGRRRPELGVACQELAGQCPRRPDRPS
jgi:hypothetical protein